MEIKVHSVLGRDVCYLLRTKHEDYSSNQGLHWSIYEFQTYGDGDTQHAPEHRVMDPKNWADALVSLAPAITQVPDGSLDDLFRSATQPSTVPDKLLQWAGTVRFDKEKLRYYSIDDQKVSSAESKRHDRRWSEVPRWADGSAFSVARLLGTEHESALEFMIRLDAAEHALETYGALVQWAHERLNKPDSQDPSFALKDAVRCYAEAWQVITSRHAVRRMVECWHRNYVKTPDAV